MTPPATLPTAAPAPRVEPTPRALPSHSPAPVPAATPAVQAAAPEPTPAVEAVARPVEVPARPPVEVAPAPAVTEVPEVPAYVPTDDAVPCDGDPERALAEARFPLDPVTLRETVSDPGQLRSIRAALTSRISDTSDPGTRARLLGLRAVTHRLLGEYDPALSDARLAVEHAESTDQLRRISLSRARLARVHQWRGEHRAADELYFQANSTELPGPLRASLFTHASRSAYDQGRLIEAATYLERALELRRLTYDAELIGEVELVLDAIAERATAVGFGPMPRQRISPEQRVPDGDYADAQPYRDGLAWVRRAEDDDWMAVDPDGRVVISAGYDDVRPFRYGVAAVRRASGWGAVDTRGKVMLSFSYDQFCTALADGRYVEGFTEEGLAVVERGGRKGVVDRTGRVLIQPAYRGLVIHPVAYLIVSAEHRWGALDRRGDEIIEPVFASRAEVIEHVERMMSTARPVL
ncbi:WG repeat-containing protein [Longispora fulva]|uniref:Tetratricopeptide (TPR) repeat protein n=1 Tax=Longispora fulva TaxID=619741 RepID=A0A8J7GTG6_9ACTN|nr:WG repeat-containing protein [Longispora fulva]MBG6138224.1 tetratricopeptide (TPR) repeat protein [Longispora fulva]